MFRRWVMLTGYTRSILLRALALTVVLSAMMIAGVVDVGPRKDGRLAWGGTALVIGAQRHEEEML